MMKRLISWLLCLALLLSAVPVGVFAQEAEAAAEAVTGEIAPEKTEGETQENVTEALAEESAPVETAAEETAAEEPAAEESAPVETVAEESVPVETETEESAPVETVPEETEAVPQETEAEVLLEQAEAGLEPVSEEDWEDQEDEEGPIAEGECGTGLLWTVTEAGVLTISGSGAMADYTEEELAPWYDYSGSVETLVVEEGVTSIGSYAFYDCSSILTVDLPDSLVSIGDFGFAYCYGLTELTLAKNIRSLGMGAFYNCYDLMKISFPKNLEVIGPDAFCECEGLETLSFPDKLRTIGDNAFSLCYGLTKVTFGSGLQSIGSNAFLECENLAGVSFPASLRTIGDFAFSTCANLTKATFQEGLQSIGQGAFQDCGLLAKIALPKSLRELGDAAFHSCYSLTSAALKDGLEKIGEEAFAYCELLGSLTIPKSVKTIGRSAFTDCISITSLTLQEGLEEIGEEAFAYCASLTSVKFPKSLTVIREGAFSGCELMTKATLPKTIAIIGDGAFDGCYDLTMTVAHGSMAEWYAENNGILYTYSDKCAHGSIIHVEPRDADCDNAGNYEYWICEKCGTIWEDEEQLWLSNLDYVTIAPPHEIIYMEYTEPDCETPGNIEYWYCELCQRVWLDEELTVLTELSKVILQADHILTHYDPLAVTCQDDGNLEYWYCEYCEGVWLDEGLTQSADPEAVLLPASHDLTHAAEKEPTCQENGNLEYWHCRRCDEYWQDEQLNQGAVLEDLILPKSHDLRYGEEAEPNCTQPGQLEHWYCTLCQGCWLDEDLTQPTRQDQVILPAKHTLTRVAAVAPTCEADGNPEYWYCSACEGYWLDEALTKSAGMDDLVLNGGHIRQHRQAQEATCQQEGCLEHWYCERCGGYWLDEALTKTAKKDQVILPKAHRLTHKEAVEATCEANGNPEYWHCSLCGGYWLDEALTQTAGIDDIILPGGHQLHRVKARPAGCKEPGCLEHWYCDRCQGYWLDAALTKETNKEAVILKAAHSPEFVKAREATCLQEGCIDHWACSGCDSLWLDEAMTREAAREDVILGYAHKLTYFDAREAGCTEPGNPEYWTCEFCGGCWLDAELKQSVDADQVTIPGGHKTVHVPLQAPTMTEGGNLEHWYCERCGGYWLDKALTKVTDPESVLLPSYSDAPESAILSGSCGGNVVWTLYLLDGTLSITGVGPMADYTATKPAPWQEQAGQIRAILVSGDVTRVGSYAFRGCTALEHVVLPQGITSIGEYAFTGCTALEEVTLPQGLKELGNAAFRSCGALKNAALPDSLEKIGGRVFAFCPQLVLTVWPDSLAERYATDYSIQYVYAQVQPCDHENVKHVAAVEPDFELPGCLEHWICDDCGKLYLDAALTQETTREQVILPSKEETLQDSSCGEKAYWTFDPMSGTVTILGAGEMYDFNQNKPAPWAAIADRILILRVEKGITGIGARAFRDCVNLAQVTLPDGLLEIRDSAFRGTGVQTVKIPKTVRTIASHAFRDCAALEQLELSEGLRTLGTRAFAGCTGLKQLTLPESLSNMSSDIFSGCNIRLTVYPNSLAEKYATQYAISYKYAGQLPQAETIALLGPGGENVTGMTLAVDMFEADSLWLFADLGPEGTTGKVTWRSSSTTVATVKEGLVTLNKPGKVTITATLAAEKRVSASVALEVSYLDEAKTLTARAAVPEQGLQQGETVTMEVFGLKGKLSPDTLRFWTSKEEVATVDEAGVITAQGTSGTVTVTAAIVDDPLNRRVSVKLKVIPAQVRVLELIPEVEGGQIIRQNDGTYLLSLDQGRMPESFTVRPRGLSAQGKELTLAARNLKWSASNPKVASVSSGKVKLKNLEGECVITAQVPDLLKAEGKLIIRIRNYAPQLAKASLELNKNLVEGVRVALTERGGNRIQAVSIHEYDNRYREYKSALSDHVTVDWNAGTLTLQSLKELSKGSMKLLLKVYCENGTTYEYPLKLTVLDTMPSVTVKALDKFNLFYKNSTARFQLTAKDAVITQAELDFGQEAAFDSRFDPKTGVLTVFYSDAYLQDQVQWITKGKLLVSLAGYKAPVEKNFTIETENAAPKLSISPASSLVNTALGSPLTTVFQVLPYSRTMEVTVMADFARTQVEGTVVTLTLLDEEGCTADVYVTDPNWTEAIHLTHKVKVTKKLPTFTLSSKKLKLDSLQTILLNQNNAVIDRILLEPTSKSAKVLAEAAKICFEAETYGDWAELRVFTEGDILPKKGTYEFRVTVILESGQKLSPKTFKVAVE